MSQLMSVKSVPWTEDAMRDALESFSALYEHRPITDNTGGMRSPHMFLSWFVLQALKPQAIIESGVWRGQGTWFFERACRSAQLYCIEPNGWDIVYRSPRATYLKQDFATLGWTHLPLDQTVVFFDDHQNAVARVKDAQRIGFTHLLFEDNYPPGQGDCYSLKQAFMRDGEDAAFLRQVLEVYEELPPIFTAERTRWGDRWEPERYPTPEPLLASVGHEYQRRFQEEATSYTWMCYVKLRAG